MVFFRIWIPAVVGLVLWLGPAAPRMAAAIEEPDKAVVQLIVDFGDGFQKRYRRLPWKQNMTVLQVLEAAREHPRGIQFKYRGQAETAFLTEIDGLENEGRGNNWIFRVNDELGDRSFALVTVGRGHTVLWTFGKYQ